MSQRHKTLEREAEARSSRDGDATLPDVLQRTLRRTLDGKSPENASVSDLRLIVRDLCERALDTGLRAEQLLLVLKAAWRALPEIERLTRVDADEVLARVVAACIEEYYVLAGAGTAQSRTRRAFDGKELDA